MGRRIGKWVFRLVVLLILVYAGAYGFQYQQYRAKLTEFRAMGYPTSMDELRAWDPVESPELNAAIPMHKAFDKLVLDYSDDLLLPVSGVIEIDVEPDERYSDEVIRDIGIVLDLNRESLELIHASTHLEKYRPEIAKLDDSTHWEWGASLRCTSRFLFEEMLYRSHRGDIEGATRSIEAIFWSARMHRQYPDIISMLVAQAIDGFGVAAVEDMVNRQSLTVEQLQRLEAVLIEYLENLNYERTFVGEPVINIGFITSLDNYLSYEDPATDPLGFYDGVLDSLKFAFDTVSLDYTSYLLETFRIHHDQLRILSYNAWYEIPDELVDIDEKDMGEISILEGILSPALTNYSEIIFLHRAKVKSIITGLRVEQYRLKYGRLPTKLDDLVPEFMESVPHGLFVDEPIGYEIDEAGYVVYAVAESRVEDIKISEFSERCDCVDPGRYGFRRYLR